MPCVQVPEAEVNVMICGVHHIETLLLRAVDNRSVRNMLGEDLEPSRYSPRIAEHASEICSVLQKRGAQMYRGDCFRNEFYSELNWQQVGKLLLQ